MITRRKAKMASNSDSVEFDINNQLGMVNTEDNTTPSDPNSAVGSQEERARGQASKPEDVNLQMLMDFIRQQSKKQEESNQLINEKLDKQKEEQEESSRLISKKLDQHKEEMKLSLIHI